MNDYKELVVELRSEAENMRECNHDPWTADDYDKAADAIEQLVKEYNELDKAHNEMFLELCKVKKERDALKEKLKIVWGWRGATD